MGQDGRDMWGRASGVLHDLDGSYMSVGFISIR